MEETLVVVVRCVCIFVLLVSVIFLFIDLNRSLRLSRSGKRVVKVDLDDDLYAALQQFGDKNGVKDVADVIPGICAYVCDGLRDQGVID